MRLVKRDFEELFYVEIEKRWLWCASVYWTVSHGRQSLMNKNSISTGKLITEDVHPKLLLNSLKHDPFDRILGYEAQLQLAKFSNLRGKPGNKGA